MKKRKNKQKGTDEEFPYCDDCIICNLLRETKKQGLEPDLGELLEAFRRQNERNEY